MKRVVQDALCAELITLGVADDFAGLDYVGRPGQIVKIPQDVPDLRDFSIYNN